MPPLGPSVPHREASKKEKQQHCREDTVLSGEDLRRGEPTVRRPQGAAVPRRTIAQQLSPFLSQVGIVRRALPTSKARSRTVDEAVAPMLPGSELPGRRRHWQRVFGAELWTSGPKQCRLQRGRHEHEAGWRPACQQGI
eukprot:scaffold30_cov255-Pinguiococcus_pyrenoidosus.AAC.17